MNYVAEHIIEDLTALRVFLCVRASADKVADVLRPVADAWVRWAGLLWQDA
jgi:hypothetical protein